MKKIRWGILGTGKIARVFAQALKFIPDAEIHAIGSRKQETADKFAGEFNIQKTYPTYEELAKDKDVDVIYVSTPHNLHAENMILCLNNNKAVLCEKPFTVNAIEAKRVVEIAAKKSIFVMEAMWARFIPMYQKLREWIDEGKIGNIRMLHADFGFKAPFDPEGRVFNPDLAGGALLDVGIYPISLAFWLFRKKPERISSMAYIGKTGVDEQNTIVFGYQDGEIAVLSSACNTNTQKEAFIHGTDGSIKVFSPFWRSTRALIIKNGQENIIEVPFEGNGYNYQAVEVMNCLRDGKLESALMPLDESVTIMETMDSIRKEWKLKYPFEK